MPTLSSFAVMHIVFVTTACGANSDDRVGIVTILSFQSHNNEKKRL